MRLQLLAIFWFALVACSGQVAASAMAHCQTHAVKSVAFENTNAAHTDTTNLGKSSVATSTRSFATLLNSSVAVDAMDIQLTPANSHHSTLDKNSFVNNQHDCCEDQSDLHHCSSCTSCDGCSTAHGAAMPTVWLIKATIAQQKIQYFDDFYLRSQSSTQERPPKN